MKREAIANPILAAAEKQKRQREAKKHELAFDRLWELLGGPVLEKEHEFFEHRKWRFDRCHRASRVAVELHGSVWANGGHNRGDGFRRDRHKLITGAELGWLCYELTEKDITSEWLERIMRSIRARSP